MKCRMDTLKTCCSEYLTGGHTNQTEAASKQCCLKLYQVCLISKMRIHTEHLVAAH